MKSTDDKTIKPTIIEIPKDCESSQTIDPQPQSAEELLSVTSVEPVDPKVAENRTARSLTQEEVEDIVKLLAIGIPKSHIAKFFKVSPPAIGYIAANNVVKPLPIKDALALIKLGCISDYGAKVYKAARIRQISESVNSCAVL